MTTHGAHDLLARMVACSSPSGDERALADAVQSWVAERGIDVVRIGDTVVARLAPEARPRVWLMSHLDTVPVGSGWTREPLRDVWDGDVLYGRGANDAKISAATMLTALFALAGKPLRGGVDVVLTACEETNNSGAAAAIAALGLPDACVCGEPTGLEVVSAQGGLSVLAATWRGKSCHAANAGQVEHSNALLLAARDMAGLDPVIGVGAPHARLGRTTVVATQLSAGERHNVVPDVANAVFDARLSPNTSADDVRSALASLLPHADVTIRSKRLLAFETADDHPIVRAALRAAGKSHSIASRTLSDLALLQGVPGVKCGPGLSARSHTPDEFVLRDEVDAGVAFYTAVAPAMLDALAASASAEASR
ncbi:MAG: M20/M25/M40 family metallo-hydrolase [Planctomycetes bacterium]|nr:M20/M25/M40 family metallo-hydrolase [Planctomycetota bacterium]